jgi:hypothetical protein
MNPLQKPLKPLDDHGRTFLTRLASALGTFRKNVEYATISLAHQEGAGLFGRLAQCRALASQTVLLREPALVGK